MTNRPLVLLGISLMVGGIVGSTRPMASQVESNTLPLSAPVATVPAALQQRAVIDRYCVTCHNARAKIGGLALDGLDLEKAPERAEIWEKVVRKLRAGMMPPIGAPRPDSSASTALVSYLVTTLDDRAAAHPNPGRIDPLRRLNRTEYRNAIRDLLALEVDVADLLPPDDSSSGFDNISVGGLDPARLERYLTAARKVSRLAIGASTPPVEAATIIIPTDLPQNDRVQDLPFGTRGGTSFRHTFPHDGEYEFQVRLGRGGANSEAGIAALFEPHDIVVLIDGAPVKRLTVEPRSFRSDTPGVLLANGDADAHLNVRLPIKAGPHMVGAAFISIGTRLNERQRASFEKFHIGVGEDQRLLPTLQSVSIIGPYGVVGPGDTPSRKRVFTCRSVLAAGEAACARQVLSTLARRAYRRPVSDADLQPLLAFFNEGRKLGGFDAGIERALRRLLVSPEFFLRVERDPAGLPPGSLYRLSELDLASRLSFFLWSSIPDDELLEVATRGQLKDPRVLERQVLRMLQEPRAENLVTNFASQWLHLRNLDGVQPDEQIFPDFEESLRRAFRRETELFFDSIVREDRSALDLLQANYSFVNDRLARHYGIPNVYGRHFRRITFPTESPRGGLLGHGSLLTVTAYAHRTSPVIRGQWVLQNLLGSPPPPAPANVPPLPETSNVQALSMRERMSQHRANPVCSACHNVMDPIGLSLENFDAVGRWRDRTDTLGSLDVSGTMPDGTRFDGVSGLKNALLSRGDQFVENLTERLLTFALGRPVQYYDVPAIRKIVRDTAAEDYRFSAIILAIVKSTPFQMKTTVPRSEVQPASTAAQPVTVTRDR